MWKTEGQAIRQCTLTQQTETATETETLTDREINRDRDRHRHTQRPTQSNKTSERGRAKEADATRRLARRRARFRRTDAPHLRGTGQQRDGHADRLTHRTPTQQITTGSTHCSSAQQALRRPPRPTDRPTVDRHRPTGRPTDRPTDRPTGSPTDQPTDRPCFVQVLIVAAPLAARRGVDSHGARLEGEALAVSELQREPVVPHRVYVRQSVGQPPSRPST